MVPTGGCEGIRDISNNKSQMHKITKKGEQVLVVAQKPWS